MSILIITISLLLWGLVHSLLASDGIKNRLVKGIFKRGYRLFFNIFSLLSFLPILYLVATLPDKALYSIPTPISYGLLVGQALALILLIVGVLQTDVFSFIGLRQLFDDEKPAKFVTGGLYRFVRHPLYTAGLLLLWLSSSMTVNTFMMAVGVTIYLFVGAYFEEKKLVREFGTAYEEYKYRTPMLIPFMKF